jgi:hypothetical protein
MNRTLLLRSLLAAMLGVSAALIVACGSDNGKLIPYADAGPLKSDFEAVAQVAETGDGSCALTKAAIEKTEQDFRSLPATVDAGLRETMRQGIDNLRTQALTLCLQPIAQTTTTGTTATKTTPSTTTTSTTTTPTTITTTTSTTPTTPTGTTPSTTPTTTTSGGGTPAPGESPSGATGSPGGGTGVGESASGNGAESAAGSAENGK